MSVFIRHPWQDLEVYVIFMSLNSLKIKDRSPKCRPKTCRHATDAFTSDLTPWAALQVILSPMYFRQNLKIHISKSSKVGYWMTHTIPFRSPMEILVSPHKQHPMPETSNYGKGTVIIDRCHRRLQCWKSRSGPTIVQERQLRPKLPVLLHEKERVQCLTFPAKVSMLLVILGIQFEGL